VRSAFYAVNFPKEVPAINDKQSCLDDRPASLIPPISRPASKLTRDPRRAEYPGWKKRVMDVYTTFIGEHEENSTLSPIKIAVLDTGIDKTHPNLVAREERIIKKYNWTNEDQKKAVGDNNGHGTFVANLLLDYAPGAQLCVAKIAEDSKPSPPELVAKAGTNLTWPRGRMCNHGPAVWVSV
jgi:hypothetical protein